MREGGVATQSGVDAAIPDAQGAGSITVIGAVTEIAENTLLSHQLTNLPLYHGPVTVSGAISDSSSGAIVATAMGTGSVTLSNVPPGVVWIKTTPSAGADVLGVFSRYSLPTTAMLEWHVLDAQVINTIAEQIGMPPPSASAQHIVVYALNAKTDQGVAGVTVAPEGFLATNVVYYDGVTFQEGIGTQKSGVALLFNVNGMGLHNTIGYKIASGQTGSIKDVPVDANTVTLLTLSLLL